MYAVACMAAAYSARDQQPPRRRSPSVCPTPRASAARRSSPVSTSCRTESTDGRAGVPRRPSHGGGSGNAAPKCGTQFLTGARGQQSGADSRRRPRGKRAGMRRRQSRTRASSSGRSAGRSAFRAATGLSGRVARTAAAPCARAAFRPPRGSSETIAAPRAASSRAASGVVRDDRHIVDRRAGQHRCHRVLGEGQGQTGTEAVVGGVREPALGPSQGFQGYDQGPCTRVPSLPRSPGRSPPLSRPQPLSPGCHQSPSGGVGTGAYGVLDRPEARGDTCAAPGSAGRGPGPGLRGRCPACPAAESASGTASLRSSANRRWWF